MQLKKKQFEKKTLWWYIKELLSFRVFFMGIRLFFNENRAMSRRGNCKGIFNDGS